MNNTLHIVSFTILLIFSFTFFNQSVQTFHVFRTVFFQFSFRPFPRKFMKLFGTFDLTAVNAGYDPRNKACLVPSGDAAL